MKILLTGKYSPVEPLGLLYLSTALKDIDHSIRMYQEPEEILKEADGYDVVGASIYTGYHRKMFPVLDKLREKGKYVVVGGPHATYFAEDCLNHANAVVQGEGFLLVKDVILGKKEGLFKQELAVPSMLPKQLYREKLYLDDRFVKNPIKNVMTSIGCPFRCSYCYNSQYQKLYSHFKVRFLAVEDVVSECLILRNSYPLELIFFQDDYFGYKVDWLREFCKEYKKYVNVPFHCQIRPEGVTEERLGMLEKAGCCGITVALECTNERVRKELLKRNYSNKDVLAACLMIKAHGLRCRTEQMLGIPETTIEDEIELLRWNVLTHPTIAWASTFVPYRGTELGEYCVEKGLYKGNNEDIPESFFARSVLNYSEERKDQIEWMQYLFSIFAYIPIGYKLAEEFLKGEKTMENLFTLTRRHLYDKVLYEVINES